MLKTEKADFVGFINSEVIIFDNIIYNIGFNFDFSKPNSEIDFLYILNSAIYQKLNEIEI